MAATTEGSSGASYVLGLRKREDEFERVASAHLPVSPASSIWRFSSSLERVPVQGWKLHVSATVENATRVLRTVAPILERESVVFKSVLNLSELTRLNCGLFYGYSQIGKFITVYPSDDEAAVRIGHQLSDATHGFECPTVPFEQRVAPGSAVFARFGLFRQPQIEANVNLVTNPDGNLEVDRRDRNPDWATPPHGLFASGESQALGPLATTYRAFAPLMQRGKGGVYRGLDFSQFPARHCVIKEGRRFGEVDLTGGDGSSRVAHEGVVLRDLASAGVPVPQVYAEFSERGNWYLVLEWIDGVPLAERLQTADRLLTINEALVLGAQSAQILSAVHQRGWVWRDLKSTNLIIQENGDLRPIDFEDAAWRDVGTPSLWGSAGHIPPEGFQLTRATLTQDLFALGAVLTRYSRVNFPARTPNCRHCERGATTFRLASTG